MSAPLTFRFDVDGENFTSAGEASVQVKKNLRSLGIAPETIRRVSIAMYEGEINMVIHAGRFFYRSGYNTCSRIRCRYGTS